MDDIIDIIGTCIDTGIGIAAIDGETGGKNGIGHMTGWPPPLPRTGLPRGGECELPLDDDDEDDDE